MKKHTIKLVICFIGTVLFINCSKSTMEDVKAKETPKEDSPKDTVTVTKITYKANIKSIMDDSCVSCHGSSSPSGSVPLVTYTQVKNSAKNGRLIDVMKGADPVMPPSGKLSDDILNLVDKWKADGYLEE